MTHERKIELAKAMVPWIMAHPHACLDYLAQEMHISSALCAEITLKYLDTDDQGNWFPKYKD